MNEDIKDAIDLITELGGSMAQENCPLAHVLLADGHVVEGEPDKFGRKTIQIPQKKSAPVVDPGFLQGIIDKLSGPTSFHAETEVRLRPDLGKAAFGEVAPRLVFTALKSRKIGEAMDFFVNTPWTHKTLMGFTKPKMVPCCDWDTDGDGNCPRHPDPETTLTASQMYALGVDESMLSEEPRKEGQATGSPPAVRNTVNGPIQGAAVEGLVNTIHDELIFQVDPDDKINLEKIKTQIDKIMKKMGNHPQVNTGRFSGSYDFPFIMADLSPIEMPRIESGNHFKHYWRHYIKPRRLPNFEARYGLPDPAPTTEISFLEFINHVESTLPNGGLVHFTWDHSGRFSNRQELEKIAQDAVANAMTALNLKGKSPWHIHKDNDEIKMVQMRSRQDILFSCGRKRERAREASLIVTIQADGSLVLTKDRTSALGGTKISSKRAHKKMFPGSW